MSTSRDKSALGGGAPLYVDLAARLRERIFSGQLAPGQRLETEANLAAEFGVSRATIRSTLNLLQREGLIAKQQGLPSFVRSRRVQQTSARLSTLEETLSEQGLDASMKILSFSFHGPPDQVRAALDLGPDDDILHINRLHLVSGEPIAVVQLSLPAEFTTSLSRKDVETHPLYELLPASLGIGLGGATQRVRAEAAAADVARWLQVDVGTALLTCERITFSKEGRPLIHALFQHAGDRFEFVVDLPSSAVDQLWTFPGLSLAKPVGAAMEKVINGEKPGA